MDNVVTKERFAKQVLEWVGTPYLHQGRSRDSGCDCVGLLLGACWELGIKEDANIVRGYSPMPNGRQFLRWCHKFLDPQPYVMSAPIVPQLELGDIMVFWIADSRFPTHLGCVTDISDNNVVTITHSYQQVGRVMQDTLNDYWMCRISGICRLPELQEI